MSNGFGGTVNMESDTFVDGFSGNQLTQLTDKLDNRFVRSRPGGGMQLSYIEGHHAIREANRIFGFGTWDRRLEELTLVHEGDREAGGGTRYCVSYIAKVQILVQVPDNKEPIVREGIGAGHGFSKNPGEAHESAAKEAETDAMKRALMTFGDPFGLALYDKDKSNVEFEVYSYPLPEPKNGGSRDDVVAWVMSQGARVEGDVVKSTKPIEALESRTLPALEKKKESRSIEMNPDILKESE